MAAADGGVPTRTDRQPGGPRPDVQRITAAFRRGQLDDPAVHGQSSYGRRQRPDEDSSTTRQFTAGFPRPTTDEVIERNVVSNAASSDFAAVALSESQLERA